MKQIRRWFVRWSVPGVEGFFPATDAAQARRYAKAQSQLHPGHRIEVLRGETVHAVWISGEKEETMNKKPVVDPNAFWALDEFRCVRPSVYPHGTPIEGMQGHYIRAANEDEARAKMAAEFPGEDFVVRLWRKGEKSWKAVPQLIAETLRMHGYTAQTYEEAGMAPPFANQEGFVVTVPSGAQVQVTVTLVTK